MFFKFFIVLSLLCCCCCAINVTKKYDVITFYKNFVDYLLIKNSEYVTNECKTALNTYWSRLKRFDRDALKSK